MKKNLKVLQIGGFKGLLLTFFMFCCLLAGFVAFPSFLAMHAWNFFSIKTGSFPAINFLQGILLWAIIVFSIFVFSKKKFIVSLNSSAELSEDEVKEVISMLSSGVVNNELNPKIKSEVNEKIDSNKGGKL